MNEGLSTGAIVKSSDRSIRQRTPAPNAGTAGPPRRTAIPYRADLDGLRAFAVLIILWFHSGLPGLPGGFIGVDIFFVISGYLITSIVHRDAGEGRFRFAHFYERRFRRIAPALLVVTAATMIASFPLLLANELDELATSAVATVAMVPNIYFWGAVNYFEQSLWARPLLHTWSLGVEEQFYVLFPAALLIAERIRLTRRTIATLLLLSFALCLYATPLKPAASFYLLPTRGWELMIGASLAVGLVSVPPRLREAGAIGGVALMVAGCLLLSPEMPFPGWRALVPTIGAGLMIASGARTIAARAFSLTPIVYVGRISYSLYPVALANLPVDEALANRFGDTALMGGWRNRARLCLVRDKLSLD